MREQGERVRGVDAHCVSVSGVRRWFVGVFPEECTILVGGIIGEYLKYAGLHCEF